jgi:hypothetical protein
VYGQREFLPGQDVAMRLVVRKVTKWQVETVKLKEVKIYLIRQGTSYLLFQGEGQGGDTVEAIFRMPQWGEGRYRLKVEAKIQERKKLSLTEWVYFRSNPAYSSLVKFKRLRQKKGEGPFRVEMFPEGARLISGLKNIVFLRIVSDDYRPFQTEFKLRLVQGRVLGNLPQAGRTDLFGISLFWLQPIFNLVRFEVVIKDSELREFIYPIELKAEPGQIIAHADSPFPIIKTRQRFQIISLHGYLPFYIDMFQNGAWIAAGKGRLYKGRSSLEIRTSSKPGLVLYQIYPNFHSPGQGVSTRYVFARNKETNLKEAFLKLAGVLYKKNIDRRYISHIRTIQVQSQAEIKRCAMFLLTRLGAGYYLLPLLGESLSYDQKRLQDFKRRFRGSLNVALIIAGFTLLFLFGYIFFSGRVESLKLRREIDEGFQCGQSKYLERFYEVFQVLILLGIIISIFITVVILLEYLRWK